MNPFQKTKEEKELLKELKKADKLGDKVNKAKADYHLNGKLKGIKVC